MIRLSCFGHVISDRSQGFGAHCPGVTGTADQNKQNYKAAKRFKRINMSKLSPAGQDTCTARSEIAEKIVKHSEKSSSREPKSKLLVWSSGRDGVATATPVSPLRLPNHCSEILEPFSSHLC